MENERNYSVHRVQSMSSSTDITTYLPLLLLCCMLPLLMGRGTQQSQSNAATTEMDIWFTGYTDQEAYDAVVKETDEIRQKAEAEANTKKSRFPSISFRRGKKERYSVEQTIPPHLYRVSDRDDGPMYFEFSDAEGGGTQVKATFSEKNKASVQNIKAKMPTRKLMAATSNSTMCPSCGKPRLPEWQLCPYCGSKYG